jgi:hypothetical protein
MVYTSNSPVYYVLYYDTLFCVLRVLRVSFFIHLTTSQFC